MQQNKYRTLDNIFVALALVLVAVGIVLAIIMTTPPVSAAPAYDQSSTTYLPTDNLADEYEIGGSNQPDFRDGGNYQQNTIVFLDGEAKKAYLSDADNIDSLAEHVLFYMGQYGMDESLKSRNKDSLKMTFFNEASSDSNLIIISSVRSVIQPDDRQAYGIYSCPIDLAHKEDGYFLAAREKVPNLIILDWEKLETYEQCRLAVDEMQLYSLANELDFGSGFTEAELAIYKDVMAKQLNLRAMKLGESLDPESDIYRELESQTEELKMQGEDTNCVMAYQYSLREFEFVAASEDEDSHGARNLAGTDFPLPGFTQLFEERISEGSDGWPTME